MLNLQTYNQEYSYEKYTRANNYDDLISIFIDDLEMIENEYINLKLNRVTKNIGRTNEALMRQHKIAIPVVVSIDAAFKQFTSFIINEQERLILSDTYCAKRRGKQLIETPLNELVVKMNNAHRVVDQFRNLHKLVVKRYYYYENNTLHVSNGSKIMFRPDSISDLILAALFKNPQKSCSTQAIRKRLLKHGNSTDEDLVFSQIERACEYINNKVKKETKNNLYLISHTEKQIKLNLILIDK